MAKLRIVNFKRSIPQEHKLLYMIIAIQIIGFIILFLK